jgi:CHAT domain-containing protein/uncharacterized protein HemY
MRHLKYGLILGFLLGLWPVVAIEIGPLPAAIAQTVDQRKDEANQLLKEGNSQLNAGKNERALSILEKALKLYQELKDREGEGQVLKSLGNVHSALMQNDKALQLFQQSLAIAQEIKNQDLEARSLNNIGGVYENTNHLEKAVEFYQIAFDLSKTSLNLKLLPIVIKNLGRIHKKQSGLNTAIRFYKDTIKFLQGIGAYTEKAMVLNTLGTLYTNHEQYKNAIASFDEALPIFKAFGDQAGQANALNGLGYAYYWISQQEIAINYYQQALTIFENIDNKNGQAISLKGLGSSYHYLGQYDKAIELHSKALKISESLDDLYGQAGAFFNLSNAYKILNQPIQARELMEKALAIFKKLEAPHNEAAALSNIASYLITAQPYKAISLYEEALLLYKQVGSLYGQAQNTKAIGNIYRALGQTEKALDLYQKAFSIFEKTNEVYGQAYTLTGIGNTYTSTKQYDQALQFYQRAFSILSSIGDREGEHNVLSSIGRVMVKQNQPQLAIVFYKQSVNVLESIRKAVPREQQESYTQTVAGTYRTLADLLLQQNRILEAQRVLDLLKVQELDDYFKDIQRSDKTQPNIPYWQPEKDILKRFNDLLRNREELTKLTSRPPKDLSSTERQRLQDLTAQQDLISLNFTKFLDFPDVIAALKQLRESTTGQSLEPEQFNQLQNNLAQLPQRSALLYPLILPDRLELVLILPDAAPLRIPVPVSSTDLNQAIVNLGQTLSDPTSDPRPAAQKLHSWLIKPLNTALTIAQIKHLVYAPDAALRYIPLGALHDGNQWLAQRYSISNITAVSLTDFSRKPSAQFRLFAGACAKCNFKFDINGQPYEFDDLPATKTEVETLAKVVPDHTVLLNQDFSPEQLKLNLGHYNIVHLATHAAFVTGAPSESFIVFGNGSRTSLSQIRAKWNLSKQDLIVLSACQTAVGSAQLGSGAEILGLGYQMQNSGAQATLASLWKVSDSGTQQLMNAFYHSLLQSGKTKTAALQQAQIALISGDFSAVGGLRASTSVTIVNARSGKAVLPGLSHPYYWAPFILIGNGL